MVSQDDVLDKGLLLTESLDTKCCGAKAETIPQKLYGRHHELIDYTIYVFREYVTIVTIHSMGFV